MNAEPTYNAELGEGQGGIFDTLIDGSHKYTDVFSDKYIGPGNAHHNYLIKSKDGEKFLYLRFQDGPIKESGVNGIMDENLIAIVIDRLAGFQSGPYASPYNETAKKLLEQALETLKSRTKERTTRGVEGTHAV